jgi:hypothetical protein
MLLTQVIWPGLFGRYGAPLPYEFDISTLAHISEGYASGDIELVVRSLLTEQRLARLKDQKVDIAEIIQWLCKVGGHTAALLHCCGCSCSCSCCMLPWLTVWPEMMA